MNNLRFLLLIVALLTGLGSQAQTKWYNPLDSDTPYIQGRAWNKEIGNTFHRFPQRARAVLRQPVWDLSTNSAGLYIEFYSNAPSITVKYLCSGGRSLPNLTTIAVSGLDLYTTDCNGITDWCACPANYRFGSHSTDTIYYRYRDLAYHNIHKEGNKYRLFLPLYNTVTYMEIGVPDSSCFKFAPPSIEKPILVYGTSIAQGASASRPAMAWSNILQRRTDWPIINLGFSGNALMDAAVYDLISEVDAKMFILDCMPNMYSIHDSIVSRTIAGVHKIRSKSKAPILLVENDGYMYGKTNAPIENECNVTNAELKKAFEQLKAEGAENIFYLTKEEIGLTPDSQTDGWHASDIGMELYANAYMKKIEDILDYHPMPLFAPCTQRREPDNYEWAERHEAILQRNRTAKPEILMIGNSITHFWGGEPTFHRQWGLNSWKKLFGKRNVTNMGFGWDRIENVFWRIYHGELDNCSPKHICMNIGTNNLQINSNEEIVNGVLGLVKLIRQRQPQARLHIIKIYPRRGKESRVAELNDLLVSKLSADKMIDITDATQKLLLKDGSNKIDESLFRDGLHPNEEGYARIANLLKPLLK
jgi:lysophospholipase L1-like esterase